MVETQVANTFECTQVATGKDTAFEQLFINMLNETYWSEKFLVDALQKLSDAATSEVLKDAFEDHMFVTQKHVKRLEKVYRLLGRTPEEKKCMVMEALGMAADNVIAATKENSMTRDAGLIIAAQKVEHQEIATYGSLVQVALTLEHYEAAVLLEKTLWEEEDTDSTLTEIAESDINPMADEEEPEETSDQSE